MKNSRLLQGLIGITISLITLIWSLSGIAWNDVWLAMHGIRWWLLIPIICTFYLHCWFRAYRWRFLLPPPRTVKTSLLMDGIIIGNLCTFILPLRAGEFVRPLVVSRQGTYRYPLTLASVIVERFFDLSAVLCCFAWLVFQLPALPNWVYHGASALGVVAGGLLTFILVGILFKQFIINTLSFITKPLSARTAKMIISWADEVLLAASELKNKQNFLAVVGLTMIVWISSFLFYYLMLLVMPALQSTTTSSVKLAVAVNIIVALAVAAPSAPGFVGIYQVGCIAAFELFQIPKELAVGYALVSHAIQYALAIGTGLYAVKRQGIGWKEIRTNK